MAKQIRFGLIGAGRWGKNYIRTLAGLSDRCRLTHLCTSHPENASLVAHPVEVLADWRKLISAQCDAVIISSPSHTHAQMAEACLDAGKPFIVEKPFFLDMPAAERVCARIEAAKLPVLVEYTQLFNPAYQALKWRLSEMREKIHLIVSEGMSLGPFRGDEPALWNWCSHDVGMCLDLLGKTPDRVEALAGPRDAKGRPEQVSVRLDFPQGAAAWIQVGYLSPQKRRQLSVFTDEQLYSFDDLAADKLTVSPFSFPKRYQGPVPSPLVREPIALSSATPPLTAAVLYFLDALQGGDRSLCEMRLTLELTRILARCEARLARKDA